MVLITALKAVYGKATSNSPRIPPDCIILADWVFENFILADEPFVKVLKLFETWVLVNNNLCGKLVFPLDFPIKFDGRFITY